MSASDEIVALLPAGPVRDEVEAMLREDPALAAAVTRLRARGHTTPAQLATALRTEAVWLQKKADQAQRHVDLLLKLHSHQYVHGRPRRRGAVPHDVGR
jgi:hypothetical protein